MTPEQLEKITDFEENGTKLFIIQFNENGRALKQATLLEFLNYLSEKIKISEKNNFLFPLLISKQK
jgi:hypothetical protein